MNHDLHSGHGGLNLCENLIVRDYLEANDRMHAGIAIEFSGDTNLDFLCGMIPHHQGAIDMARDVTIHGSDPEVRELAQAIITAQSSAIELMKIWPKK